MIFSKFQDDWTKIADFLLMTNFLMCAVFSYSDFMMGSDKKSPKSCPRSFEWPINEKLCSQLGLFGKLIVGVSGLY